MGSSHASGSMLDMAAPSVNLRPWWFAALGGGLLVAVLALAMPGPQPGLAPTAMTPPPAPVVPASTARPAPIATAPERRDITAPLLQVIDWQGRPVAARLTFLADGELQTRDDASTGVAMPTSWSHVLVQQANWLPLCFPATAVETRAQGCWFLRLPEPSLTARIVAPADVETVQLFAEVDAWSQAHGWPAGLRQHVFGTEQPSQPWPLELPCADGELSCGGLPADDLAILTRSPLVFRSRDGGISDRWQARVPVHGATIELVHKPVLRVTPRLHGVGLLDGPLSLVVDQFDQGSLNSLGGSQHTATLDVATAVELDGKARYAKLLLRAGKDEQLVAMDTVKLTQRDQDAILEVGKDALTITVVDGAGTPVPDACVLEQDELLGTTDRRGEVQILTAQSGPIDAMARGFDCAQVGLAELRQTRRIVLPPLTTLVVDARRAARALGTARVMISGGFASPCSSRTSGRLLGEWNERGPSLSQGSGMNGGRITLDELGYDTSADRMLTLVGLFQPGAQVTIALSDHCGAPTGVSVATTLARGETNRVELAVPEVVHFAGTLVSARDGQLVGEAKVAVSGTFWLIDPESVRDGRLDLRLAKDSHITVEANGYVTRTFAAPQADGVYLLTPARRLSLRIVDAGHRAVACRGSLVDGSGQEYGAMAGQPGGELQFDEVPDQALSAKLRRGDEVREFAVPAGATSWTVEWR